MKRLLFSESEIDKIRDLLLMHSDKTICARTLVLLLKSKDIPHKKIAEITGLCENISSHISSLCVSPFSAENEALVALGTYHGTLQVI